MTEIQSSLRQLLDCSATNKFNDIEISHMGDVFKLQREGLLNRAENTYEKAIGIIGEFRPKDILEPFFLQKFYGDTSCHTCDECVGERCRWNAPKMKNLEERESNFLGLPHVLEIYISFSSTSNSSDLI